MAISYLLAPNPKWYIADLVGRPLGGGYLATYRSLDKTQQKFVYQDPGGNFVWPYSNIPNTALQGILFDENGAQGPFYWSVDSSNLNDTYFLEVYDAGGVLQWTADNFAPPGSGGGGNVTTGINIDNLVINNVFWRNLSNNTNPATPISISSTYTVIAPGCHAGLSLTQTATPPQNAGPDIVLLKNNTLATDIISFPYFTLGTQPLTGDVAPVQYLNYKCTGAGIGETQKCIQIPITCGVQNLTNKAVTFTIWARGNSGANTLTIQWRTFYGDGAGASADDLSPIQILALSAGWGQFNISANVPDVTGKTLGGCGNSGLFLQIQYPLGATFDIDLTKPSIYLGSLSPIEDFMSYDRIDGVLNVPRSGDVRPSYGQAPLGWINMNDGTIGNASSNATTRANIDTFPLYNLIWNSVSNTFAPLTNSAGTPVARGANAIADFTANNRITLTRTLGRVLGCYGAGSGLTSRSLGEFLGAETAVIAQTNLPAGQLSGCTVSGTNLLSGAGSAITGLGPPGGVGTNVNINLGGSGTPFGIMQPSTFANFMIKL